MIYSSPPRASVHAKCGTDLPVVCVCVCVCVYCVCVCVCTVSRSGIHNKCKDIVFSRNTNTKNLTYCNNPTTCITYSSFLWYMFCQLSRLSVHNNHLVLSWEKRRYTSISHFLWAEWGEEELYYFLSGG